MKSLIIRIIHQMKNDHRTMALMFMAPIIILTLLYFLLGDTDYQARILVSPLLPAPLVTLMGENADIAGAEGGQTGTAAEIDQLLREKEYDAYLFLDGRTVVIRMLEKNAVKLAAVTTTLQDALARMGAGQTLRTEFILGPADGNLFQETGYVLLGVLSFFFVFIIAGIAFVRERESGTLERLMITPVRRRAVVGGYTLGYGFFAALQAIFIILYTHLVLGLNFAGSVFAVILIMVLLAFAAVSTGTLVSIFANNEFQVMQFIPIVIIPQMFFAGLLDLDTLPYGLGRLAWIMPVHYGCAALKEIMVNGARLVDIGLYLGGLLGFNVLLLACNVLALRKYRQI